MTRKELTENKEKSYKKKFHDDRYSIITMEYFGKLLEAISKYEFSVGGKERDNMHVNGAVKYNRQKELVEGIANMYVVLNGLVEHYGIDKKKMQLEVGKIVKGKED